MVRGCWCDRTFAGTSTQKEQSHIIPGSRFSISNRFDNVGYSTFVVESLPGFYAANIIVSQTRQLSVKSNQLEEIPQRVSLKPAARSTACISCYVIQLPASHGVQVDDPRLTLSTPYACLNQSFQRASFPLSVSSLRALIPVARVLHHYQMRRGFSQVVLDPEYNLSIIDQDRSGGRDASPRQ